MLFLYEAILVSRYTVFLVECRASPEDFRYKKGNLVGTQCSRLSAEQVPKISGSRKAMYFVVVHVFSMYSLQCNLYMVLWIEDNLCRALFVFVILFIWGNSSW
ncbi:hypothetical protein Godav_024275 [Gossypium davidsonii]|uniref:Uncharacterized protein n=1 Tax=Gossypium davidsonii TaxID=34287 RepID=A0A7J8SUG8_GOSDV|nr:hypothetical protein [Gossypium davidsonii]